MEYLNQNSWAESLEKYISFANLIRSSNLRKDSGKTQHHLRDETEEVERTKFYTTVTKEWALFGTLLKDALSWTNILKVTSDAVFIPWHWTKLWFDRLKLHNQQSTTIDLTLKCIIVIQQVIVTHTQPNCCI